MSTVRLKAQTDVRVLFLRNPDAIEFVTKCVQGEATELSDRISDSFENLRVFSQQVLHPSLAATLFVDHNCQDNVTRWLQLVVFRLQ